MEDVPLHQKFWKLALAGTLVGSTLLTAIPASAGNDGTKRVLATAGSDTTSPVVEALAKAYNVSTANADNDLVVNVPPLHTVSADLRSAEGALPLKAWLEQSRLGWPAGQVVPGDADCTAERVYGGEGSQDTNNDGDVTDLSGGSPDLPYQTADIDIDGDSNPGEANVPGERVQFGAVAPNGSSSGQTYARDFANNPLGCVDMVRSSSAPSATNQVNLDSWGFALDAIGWNYFPGNSHGVTALTKTQLGKVYTCATTNVDGNTDGDFTDVGDTAAGAPSYRYWGDLSGNTADTTPIKAYRIQNGSGTGKDVAVTLLGLADNPNIGDNCTPNPSKDSGFPTTQEHDCQAVADLDKPNAICFYGYSRWRLQARGLEADKRNGAIFGAFAAGAGTPLKPTATTIKEDTGRYDGTRIVYNLVTKQTAAGAQPLLPGFRDAIDFVGVRSSSGVDVNNDGDTSDASDIPSAGSATPGWVCSNVSAQKILRVYGLVPFKLGTTDATDANYGTSYCRHNKFAL